MLLLLRFEKEKNHPENHLLGLFTISPSNINIIYLGDYGYISIEQKDSGFNNSRVMSISIKEDNT